MPRDPVRSLLTRGAVALAPSPRGPVAPAEQPGPVPIGQQTWQRQAEETFGDPRVTGGAVPVPWPPERRHRGAGSTNVNVDLSPLEDIFSPVEIATLPTGTAVNGASGMINLVLNKPFSVPAAGLCIVAIAPSGANATGTVTFDGGKTWWTLNAGTNLTNACFYSFGIPVNRGDSFDFAFAAAGTVGAFRSYFQPTMI